MKYKKNSSEFMEEFDKATQTLDSAMASLVNLKNDIRKKIDLITLTNAYFNDKLSSISISDINIGNKIVLSDADIVEGIGLYNSYGMSITPYSQKTPINVCNFYTGEEYIYKNNMKITINGKHDDEFKNVLMHDSIKDKDIYLKYFDTDEITIDIEAPSNGMIGSIKMNTIEVFPYLAGSFDIKEINIYSIDDTKNAAHKISNIVSVPKSRYILDSRATISHIEFKLKLKYKNPANDKYVFGAKHIYLLDANYDMSGSFVVIKITKDKNIEYIYDNIYLNFQNGSNAKFNASDLGIRYFASYDNGELSREITMSTDVEPSYISANTRTVYMRIPVYTSYTSITPDIRVNINDD